MNSGASASGLPGSFDLVGRVTPRRLVRVLFHRWYVVFASLAVGAAIAAAVCAFMPPVYESVSTFTFDFRGAATSGFGDEVSAILAADGGMSYAELFNTRYSEWRSEEVVLGLLKTYRAKRPGSLVTDEEVLESLRDSTIEVKPYSRLVQVSVRASTPQLCTDLSTAYVDAIVANAEKQNAKCREKAVSFLDGTVDKQRVRVAALTQAAAAARVTNGVDALRVDLDIAERSLSHVSSELLRLEGEELRLQEEAKLLQEVADDPSAYGKLVAGDRHSAEIARLARECDELEKKCRALLGAVTKRHPVVRQAGRELLAARSRLKAAARRAADSGQAALREIRPRIDALAKRKTELELERYHYERLIAMSEGDVSRNERTLASAHTSLESLLVTQNRLVNAAETARESILPGCPPSVPEKPVIPNPLVVYGAALFVAAAVGVFLCLFMDTMDDPVLDIWDVMRRAGRPVLALLPHVPSDVRGDAVRLMVDDPHSEFAERVRGLRQLLDSPRFEIATKRLLVVSTCPGEGKTVTAASLAVAFAQSGRRMLLVDFDLRRPQQAGIWKLNLTPETSLSHVLTASVSRSPDFSTLAQPSGVEGLDVMASLPPDGVDPATLAGSNLTKALFAWARLAYDGIVVDAPPFGVVADVVPLSCLVDSVMVMCRPDRTNAGNLAACVNYLTDAGAEILGVVVNDADASGTEAFKVDSDRRAFRKCPDGADPVAFDETRQFSDED